MNTDARVGSDLKAFAAATERGLPSREATERWLAGASIERPLLRSVVPWRRPVMISASVAVAAAALVVPLPYSRHTGWDVTLTSADGRVATVHLPSCPAAIAQRRAAALASTPGTTVAVAPHVERVWGSAYAMVEDKILRVDVDTTGKTDAEVEAEVRKQLEAEGWNPTVVEVRRGDPSSTLVLGADDGQGRQVEVVSQSNGQGAPRVEVQVDPIDDAREPGMTDDQLRDKILRQLHARGLDGEVVVDGDRVEIRATRESGK